MRNPGHRCSGRSLLNACHSLGNRKIAKPIAPQLSASRTVACTTDNGTMRGPGCATRNVWLSRYRLAARLIPLAFCRLLTSRVGSQLGRCDLQALRLVRLSLLITIPMREGHRFEDPPPRQHSGRDNSCVCCAGGTQSVLAALHGNACADYCLLPAGHLRRAIGETFTRS